MAKASVKTWLKPSYEFKEFVTVCIWACGAELYTESLVILQNRILKLIEKGGLPFTYGYLKEVLRLTVRYLAGQGEPHSFQKGRVMVRTDAGGLPTIIPLRLREVMREVSKNFEALSPISVNLQRIVVCILTVISIFRVFNYFPKPSLKTVVSPFTGRELTLPKEELSRAIAQIFPGVTLKMRAPRLLVLETASPNASKSTWGAVLDVACFVFYPVTGIRLFVYNLFQNHSGTRWNLWILVILTASIPLMIFIFILGGVQELFVGKLAVVKDQAGKSRIVGITNYWIQVALKPLHDGLFAMLRNIPMDGTFNQEAPLNRLIESVPKGQTFYSFDLSAATDRLPLILQRDILNLLSPTLGTDWANLLGSVYWAYKKEDYKYAVGQPMGAYSSWAMLALTHHVVVQVAALRCGISGFSSYAVLGDDIVIADDAVAREYLVLMELLGVSINLSKSLESKRFLEFAKRWIGPGVKFSPIGPGLILRLIRNKFYFAALFTSMFHLGLVTTFQELLARFNSLPAKWAGQKWNALWATFGLKSFLFTDGRVDANAITWCFHAVGMDSSFMRYNIWNALLQDRLDTNRKAIEQLEVNIKYFLENFWKIQVSRSWPNRMLEFLLKVLSPGPWAYFYEYISAKLDLAEGISKAGKSGSWSNIYDLVKDNSAINVANIDWRRKEQVRQAVERAKVIMRTYEESQRDIFYMGDNPGEFY